MIKDLFNELNLNKTQRARIALKLLRQHDAGRGMSNSKLKELIQDMLNSNEKEPKSSEENSEGERPSGRRLRRRIRTNGLDTRLQSSVRPLQSRLQRSTHRVRGIEKRFVSSVPMLED